jgi:hypothetical protein
MIASALEILLLPAVGAGSVVQIIPGMLRFYPANRSVFVEHAEHESAKKVYVEPSLQERDRLVEVAEGGPQRIGITTGNV